MKSTSKLLKQCLSDAIEAMYSAREDLLSEQESLRVTKRNLRIVRSFVACVKNKDFKKAKKLLYNGYLLPDYYNDLSEVFDGCNKGEKT